MYSYVATSQKPTAVQHAISCSFINSNDLDLVIARGNRVEIYLTKDSHLTLECEIPLYGIISSLSYYRPRQSQQDVLVILTERKQYCTLAYDTINKKVHTLATGSLEDKIARELDHGNRLLIDPESRMIAMSIYEGSLKIIPTDVGGQSSSSGGHKLRDAFNVRLDVLRYIDIQFLYGCIRPTLCILYEDNRKFKHIKTFEINQHERELILGPWNQTYVDATAHKLVSVPSPVNGVLVIGEKTISYYNGSNTPSQAVITDSIQIMSVCVVNDKKGCRFFLSDHRGHLYVLILATSSATSSSSSSSVSTPSGFKQQAVIVKSLVIDRIGIANIATCLCYIKNGVLFIGSCYGDSQLVQLHAPGSSTASSSKSSSSSSSNATSTSMIFDSHDDDDNGTKTNENSHSHNSTTTGVIEVLDTLTNIGPILDMCVIAQQQSQSQSLQLSQRVNGRGQNKLVTCSGAYKDGSLRVVSSGIGIVEQASMEMPGINGMWSMQCQSQTTHSSSATAAASQSLQQQIWDKYIVVSFLASTYVLAIENNNELAEADIPGFVMDQMTLSVKSYLIPMMSNNTSASSSAMMMMMLQVTPWSVRAVDGSTLQLLGEYTSSSKIIAVHSNVSQGSVEVVIALSDGSVTSLKLQVKSGLAGGGRCECQIVVTGRVQLDQAVACLSLKETTANMNTAATSTNSNSSNSDSMHVDEATGSVTPSATLTPVVAVGMWTDNTVRLLTLPSLTEVCRVTLSGSESNQNAIAVQARDVLLIELESITYLFFGLGDGTLIYFQLIFNSADGGVWTLISKKKVTLGVRAISLTPFVNSTSGASCIFVACDRPTIIYSHHQKILFSAVNVSQVINHMCTFHCEPFPRCLALSSESGFLIGTIDDIQKLHIQSYPLNQSPRRLAYHATTGVIAVCTEKVTRSKVSGDAASNHVIFYEENTMQPFFTFDADILEQVISCHACFLRYDDDDDDEGENSASAENKREYIVVGTAYLVPEEVEPSKGRILVFEIESSSLSTAAATDSTSNVVSLFQSSMEGNNTTTSTSGNSSDNKDNDPLQVSLVAETNTKGAVFALADTQGKLIASTGHKVHIINLKSNRVKNQLISSSSSSSSGGSRYSGSSSINPTLSTECSHTGHIMSLHIKVHGSFILIGDLMRSMTLLQYKPPVGRTAVTASSTLSGSVTAMDTACTASSVAIGATHGTLDEVARDFGANMMRSVEILGEADDLFLGTDDGGNLFTVRRQPGAETEEERGKMEYQGFFHTGDWINVIRHGSLNVQPLISDTAGGVSGGDGNTSSATTSSSSSSLLFNSKDWQSTLYGTVNGGIGTILSGLSEESYKFFHTLEKAVKHVITSGTGGFLHDDYRCFSNDRRTYNQKSFIDGDLVEAFLDMKDFNQQQAVVRHLNDELLNQATATATAVSSSTTATATMNTNTTTMAGANNNNNSSKSKAVVKYHLLTMTKTNPDSIFNSLSLSHYAYTVEDIIRILEDVSRLH